MDKPEAPSGAVAIRETFGGEELVAGGDLSPAAAAAAAKAEIEARIIAARRWRRDVDLFRAGILKDCRRPGFAAAALYHKPVGRKKNPAGEWEQQFATNFSIRFIESALGHFTNYYATARISYEDERRAILAVQVLDVERNGGWLTEMTVDKVVERRDVKKGRTVLGVRENSYGDQVYVVIATPDEFRNKLGAERSKLLRDNGQRLLPSDILDEARTVVEGTVADENAKDPDGAKKKVLDKFAAIGITPEMLKAYMDRPLESLTPKDLAELAVLYNGLKEAEFTWADVMRVKDAPAEDDAPADPKRSRIKDQILEAREKTPPKA
jgi:hypothetical protein